MVALYQNSLCRFFVGLFLLSSANREIPVVKLLSEEQC